MFVTIPMKDLERRLGVIQELKSRYYIGTQEAFSYVRDIADVYSRPERTSALVNEALRESASYRPTPERLNGIASLNVPSKINLNGDEIPEACDDLDYRVIMHLVDDFDLEKALVSGKEGRLSDFYLCDDLLHTALFLSTWNRSSYEQLRDVSLYSDLFRKANNKGVTNNLEFGSFISDEIITGLTFHPPKLNPDGDGANYFAQIDIAEKSLSSIDWASQFSRENFEASRRKVAREQTLENLNASLVMKRLKRDQVDNRWEHLRGMLSLYVEGFNSFDEVLEVTKSRRKFIKTELKRLILSSAPSREIEYRQAALEAKEELVKVISRERNWIDRYLKS